MSTNTFRLTVDGVPYIVNAVPFEFNGVKRFTVNFNGSTDFVFAFDNELKQYRALGDEAIRIPDGLEIDISQKLAAMA